MFTQFNGLFVDAMTVDSLNEEREARVWAASLGTPAKPQVRTTATTVRRMPRVGKQNDRGLTRMERMYELVVREKASTESAIATIREEYGDSSDHDVVTKNSITWVRHSLNPWNSKHEYAQKVTSRLGLTIQ